MDNVAQVAAENFTGVVDGLLIPLIAKQEIPGISSTIVPSGDSFLGVQAGLANITREEVGGRSA